MKKRVIATLMSIVIAASLCACGSGASQQPQQEAGAAEEEPAGEVSEDAAQDMTAASETVEEDTAAEGSDVRPEVTFNHFHQMEEKDLTVIASLSYEVPALIENAVIEHTELHRTLVGDCDAIAERYRKSFDEIKEAAGTAIENMDGDVENFPAGEIEGTMEVVRCDASVLRIGQTAQASFSACMNDDSFYEGAKCVWTSNNPAVATVAPDGTVKAVSMGVATVTCAVTIDGYTKEDTFAVKVMPDLGLASLKVGGKAVKLGDAASLSYLLKPGKAPKVEAAAANPAIDVTVKQAETVPGTAVVTLHDGQTGDSRQVTVNFGLKGVSDTFRKGTLNDAWHWVREDPAGWMLSSANGLVLTAGKGDIAQGGNAATNILLQSANSDWTADTKLVCAPAPPAQNAGLVAYQCDDNFVKFVRAATFSFRRPGADAGPSAGQLQLMVEENGQQKSVATLPLDGIVGADNVLWLRRGRQEIREDGHGPGRPEGRPGGCDRL